jgi:hypothetical protein
LGFRPWEEWGFTYVGVEAPLGVDWPEPWFCEGVRCSLLRTKEPTRDERRGFSAVDGCRSVRALVRVVVVVVVVVVDAAAAVVVVGILGVDRAREMGGRRGGEAGAEDGRRVGGAGGGSMGMGGGISSCCLAAGAGVTRTPSTGSSWRRGVEKERLSPLWLVGVTGSAGSLAVSLLSSSSAMAAWYSARRESRRIIWKTSGSAGGVGAGVGRFEATTDMTQVRRVELVIAIDNCLCEVTR